jgi:hypothetical protein
LQIVVMPLAVGDELPAANAAAAAFLAAFGIEPVTAFVPREAGGLVAMNSPPARMVAHEVTLNRESVGRVVNGVVVWPRAADRARLARPPLDSGSSGSGEQTLVIGATLPGAEGDEPRSLLLGEAFDVDADGFLVLREA